MHIRFFPPSNESCTFIFCRTLSKNSELLNIVTMFGIGIENAEISAKSLLGVVILQIVCDIFINKTSSLSLKNVVDMKSIDVN